MKADRGPAEGSSDHIRLIISGCMAIRRAMADLQIESEPRSTSADDATGEANGGDVDVRMTGRRVLEKD